MDSISHEVSMEGIRKIQKKYEHSKILHFIWQAHLVFSYLEVVSSNPVTEQTSFLSIIKEYSVNLLIIDSTLINDA